MCGAPGMVARAPMGETEARQRMWQSMRRLPEFTTADLVATAEVGYSNAKKYLRALRVAGYLRCARPVRSGATGGHAVYRLARNTGPFAPRIGKGALRDPNLEPHQRGHTVVVPQADYERALACVRACQGMLDPEREVAALKERAR